MAKTAAPGATTATDAGRSYENALKKYPDWAWAFNIPEVGDLLKRGVEDPSFDPIPQILQTNWYKTTQASARQYQALQVSDPESANARLKAAQVKIWDAQIQLGLPADVNGTVDLANQYLRLGWDDAQLNDVLVTRLQYKAGDPSPVGDLGTTMSAIKQAAAQYYVDISDDTAFSYARGVVAGEHQITDFTNIFRDQAKGRFPTIAAEIDKGITPTQYFAPYQERIASLLEKSPDQVKLNDPQYSWVLGMDDGKGGQRPATYNEIDTKIRSTSDWKKTRQAQQQYADIGDTILKTFGKVAS